MACEATFEKNGESGAFRKPAGGQASGAEEDRTGPVERPDHRQQGAAKPDIATCNRAGPPRAKRDLVTYLARRDGEETSQRLCASL